MLLAVVCLLCIATYRTESAQIFIGLVGKVVNVLDHLLVFGYNRILNVWVVINFRPLHQIA
jgi:hypothetical protein